MLQHDRKFYIPKESTPFNIEGFAAVAYFHEGKNGKPYAVGFRGKAQKPAFNFSFSDAAKRSAYCFSWLCDQADAEERKAERKAQAKAERAAFVNPLRIGDVLHYSWGWEQTNPEFWQVIEVRGKIVWLREIAQYASSEKTGNSMAEYRLPIIDQFIGSPEPIKKLVQPGTDYGYFINFEHGIGTFWGNREKPGRAKYCSWYA